MAIKLTVVSFEHGASACPSYRAPLSASISVSVFVATFHVRVQWAASMALSTVNVHSVVSS